MQILFTSISMNDAGTTSAALFPPPAVLDHGNDQRLSISKSTRAEVRMVVRLDLGRPDRYQERKMSQREDVLGGGSQAWGYTADR